jgi:GT2 family glycosyltransferase
MALNVLRTCAVVVDWRRPHETLEALESLASMTPCPDTIYCVENGCTREETAIVRASAPSCVELIELPTNIGFAAAVNLGMREAVHGGAEWVLLLNNDATVSKRCLGRCLEEAATFPRIAAVGPAISFADRPDKLWYGGGEMHDWFAFTRHRGLMASTTTPPPTGETAFITGCCMLISTAAWNSVGPFRADFFTYYEDAEWCQRARASGWSCRYVGEVLCAHAVSVSFSQRGDLGLSENTAYYKARNPLRAALETKAWGRRITRLVGLMAIWNPYHAWRAVQSGNPKVAISYMKGIVDGFRGRMGPRGEIQS